MVVSPPFSPAKMKSPIPCVEKGPMPGKGNVDVPAINTELSRAIGVPEIVTAGPPILTVVPAIANWPRAGYNVAACPASVITEPEEGAGRGTVEVPNISPETPRDTGVPEIVIAGSSILSVVPAIDTPPRARLTACPAMVATEFEVGMLRDIVEVPIINPLDPNEMGVPKIVIPGAFEVRVVSAMNTAVGRIVIGLPATVVTVGEDNEAGGSRAMVLAPICKAD